MVKKLDNSNTLDLHGVKHEDAERLVENFVLLNNKPLEITGVDQILSFALYSQAFFIITVWSMISTS